MGTEKKIVIGIIVFTVLLLGGGVYFLTKQSSAEQAKLSKPLMGDKIPDMTGIHIANGAQHDPYNSNPPTSGYHWANTVAGGGIKDQPLADEAYVHSMEHGAVVVWYKQDLPREQVDQVTTAYGQGQGKKILTPRKDLDVPVALTSWNHLLKLVAIDPAKITEFINTNEDRGPEKAPI